MLKIEKCTKSFWNFLFGNPKKVSELQSIESKDIQPDDLLLISDISEKTSKKVSMADIVEYVRRHGQ